VLPISGKGLWSTIYGYLALEGDLDHVRGVTFYKHGETPGLGGECENPAWCATWSGKSILDAQKKLVGVAVKKGKVDGSIPAEKAHKVDGLSGATITSNGITNFVLADLKAFDGYLTGLRSK
jgi:Na+-transporting NADH:ubiquinone oxidoreductase subunit C